jgi:hypothetical protein
LIYRKARGLEGEEEEKDEEKRYDGGYNDDNN